MMKIFFQANVKLKHVRKQLGWNFAEAGVTYDLKTTPATISIEEQNR